jgi:hypothetical protein
VPVCALVPLRSPLFSHRNFPANLEQAAGRICAWHLQPSWHVSTAGCILQRCRHACRVAQGGLHAVRTVKCWRSNMMKGSITVSGGCCFLELCRWQFEECGWGMDDGFGVEGRSAHHCPLCPCFVLGREPCKQRMDVFVLECLYDLLGHLAWACCLKGMAHACAVPNTHSARTSIRLDKAQSTCQGCIDWSLAL